MVVNSIQTHIAYRCPDCGSAVYGFIGKFALKAGMVRLKCSCGKSHMEIYDNRDNTVRLRVPCMICANPHTFSVSSGVFFSDELFVLPCPYSDINICFTGEMNLVKAELARTELELMDLLEEHGLTDLSALHGGEEALGDPQVREIVLFVINDLEEEGKIYCRCHPEGEEKREEDREESLYDAEITADGVLVTCRKCGASRLIPTDSSLSAHAFLNCDSLHLE